MDNRQARGFFGVFLEEDHGSVVSIRCEFGDLSQGELVSVAVGGAWDVNGVWKERAEELGLVVQSRVQGCGQEDFGNWWWLVGE